MGPAAALVCEEAWLRDDADRIRSVATPVHAEAARRGVPAIQAELGLWLTRAGGERGPDGVAAGQPAHPLGGRPLARGPAGVVGSRVPL